jgi:hypothetical protein
MERWKWIRRFKGLYKVSTHGRVRSVPRKVLRYFPDKIVEQKVGGKFLSIKGGNGDNPYIIVCLHQNNKPIYRYVHILVAVAFIPNPSNLREVNHKDLNPKNNMVHNLEWVSSKGNKLHARKNGVRNPHDKLNPDLANIIRRMRVRGVSRQRIAWIFDVSTTNVRNIENRKIYRYA